MEVLPVLAPDDIVPFFVNVTFGSFRLYEIIQVKLSEANAEEMTDDLIKDLSSNKPEELVSFRPLVLTYLDDQIQDYQKLLNVVPCSGYAKKGSCVHVFSVECSSGAVLYNDQFEWDIFDRSASVDDITRLTIMELGLPIQFINIMSAQIRWQIIRLRAMHAHPEKLEESIKTKEILVPQTVFGFRNLEEIADYSPLVGIISKPGGDKKANEKNNINRERELRAQKRQNRSNLSDILYPIDEQTIVSVQMVPIVRANPMPQDSYEIDLSALPGYLNEEEEISDELKAKAERKLYEAQYLPCTSVNIENY